MLRLGLTHFQSAMLIIVMQTCFILMNVLMKNVNINLLFGIDLLLGVLLVWQLDRMGDRRERKYEQKKSDTIGYRNDFDGDYKEDANPTQ